MTTILKIISKLPAMLKCFECQGGEGSGKKMSEIGQCHLEQKKQDWLKYFTVNFGDQELCQVNEDSSGA